MVLFIAIIVVIFSLGLTVSESRNIDSSADQQLINFPQIMQHDVQKTALSLFAPVSDAARFNHVNQQIMCYLLVSLLAVFVMLPINFRWYKPTVLPPPWYIVLKNTSRLTLASWKISNLQFKAQTIDLT